MRIRPASASDADAIAGILRPEIERGFAHFGTASPSAEEVRHDWEARGAYPWFVAEDDSGRVVGFARAGPWKTRGAYAWTTEVGIYIAEVARGFGAGKALYAELFAELARRGFRLVLAGITLPNEASIRLHESIGMRHVGTLPGVGFKLGAWRDVGYWALALGQGATAPPGAISAPTTGPPTATD